VEDIWATCFTVHRHKPMDVEQIGEFNAQGVPYPMPIWSEETGMAMFKAEVDDWVQDNFDVPILVSGDPRMGKSTFSLKACSIIDELFTYRNICWWLKDFLYLLQNVPGGTRNGNHPCIMYDESGVGLDSKEGMSEESKAINNLSRINGAKLYTTFYLTPHLTDMDKVLRGTRVKYWVFIKQRGLAEVRYAERDQFEKEPFWRCLYGIHYGPADKMDIWEPYNKAKMQFITDYQQTGGAHQELEKPKEPSVQENRDQDIKQALAKKLWESGVKQTEIAKLAGVDQGTVSRWIKPNEVTSVTSKKRRNTTKD